MSTNSNIANLSITVVKTLVKMAGFARVADMIDGGQECLNLLADIKNDALGDPNAEMIRSLNGAVKSELDAIQDALKHNGQGRKQVKQAAAQLAEAARETIKALAEDDDALIRAVQQPQCFAEQLRGHAAPLPDYSSDEMHTHYETLLDRLAEEFLTLAPWSPSFNRVALTSLLLCFPTLTDQVARLEHAMQLLGDKVDAESDRSREADADTHRKLDDLKDMVGGFSPAERKPLRVAFGSRPDVAADDQFIARCEQEQLNSLIADPTRRRTVLVGMRGCGKTQLAASLAEQCEEANWNLVAWINAVSPDTIQSDLVELAKRLKIDTSDQPAQDVIVRRCLDHLKSAAPADRLIVFDNVEDINHLTGLIPSGDGVRVVATTTNKVGWEDQGWNSIKVGVFDRNTSIEYLLTVTNSDDRDAADALAERLGDLPLAIAQAAATARHKELSLPRYLKRLESHRQEHTIYPVPGDDYTDDVATALWMAVEDALESLAEPTRRSARRQLGALALLAESGVPTRWLDPTIEQQDNQEVQGTNQAEDEDAHDALTELIHRSIVQQSADKATTRLHRLQAQVLRESWTETESVQAAQAAADLLSRVNISAIPRNDTKSRRRETRDLIEQLRAITTQDYSGSLFAFKQVRNRLNVAFRHAHDLGLPFEALTLNEAVDIIGELLGPDHRDTLTSRNKLAYTFLTVGRTEEAVNLYEQTLQGSITGLGEDHPHTLIARNDLAHAYQTAGRPNEAIDLHKQAVKDRTRILGEDHPHTLIARNDLAHAYQTAGHLNEAITLFTQNLQDSIRVLGKDHPDTLASRNSLAHAYRRAGCLHKAITLYEQTLTDRTRVLGKNHPDTLTSRSNLAREYQWLDRTDESITLLEQSLQDSTHILGVDHPQTLSVRNDLAHAYQAAGRLNEAITLLEQSLQDSTHILGVDHPQTLSVRNDLADAYRWANRTDEAVTLFEQAVNHRINVLGEDHPRTLSALNDLARAYRWAGRLNEAITLYKKTLRDYIRVLGEDHPDTLSTRDNLAGAYRRAGRLDEAIQLFEQTLHDCIRVLGKAHPFTATVRENLEAAKRELERQEEESAAE